MAQVLAELELVSHGRTMRPDGRVAGSKDPSPILHVDEEPYPHENFRPLWETAETADRRRQVLADAKTTLEAMRKAPPPPEQFLVRFSFSWKRMIGQRRRNPYHGACPFARHLAHDDPRVASALWQRPW
jgi:hypothetical protein